MGDKIRVMYSEEEVDKRIRELGEQISKRYEGKTVHMICVLKGGVFFMCELAKRITIPVTIDFMSVSSYGNSRESSGIVKIAKDLQIKNFSCHSLRKTFGRQVYNMNSDNAELALVKLMELFNHSSVAITKRYLGLRQEEILQTYDCLSF